MINLLSFGFKYGPPVEADTVFDVRFLPNPYYVPQLKMNSGLVPEVSSYVLDNPVAKEFFDRLIPLLKFMILQYQQKGGSSITIAIGCTGGRHRSVAVAEKLTRILTDAGENVSVMHRNVMS